MKFADIEEVVDYVNEQMDRFLDTMDPVKANELGLDSRAGYDLWVDKQCIVTTVGSDSSLQYYGGAEYIDKEFRTQIGDYVIYRRDGGRVDQWIDRYFSNEEMEEV